MDRRYYGREIKVMVMDSGLGFSKRDFLLHRYYSCSYENERGVARLLRGVRERYLRGEGEERILKLY